MSAVPSENQQQRTLRVALGVVVAAMVVALWPWLFYDYEFGQLGVIVWPVLTPVAVIVAVTSRQLRAGRAPMTFEPARVAAAAFVISAGYVALSFLGYLGFVVMAVAVPVAASFMALAWVQPPASRKPATVLLAVGVVPFVVWFAGRADERTGEAVVSGLVIAAAVMALWAIRRQRRDALSHSVASG